MLRLASKLATVKLATVMPHTPTSALMNTRLLPALLLGAALLLTLPACDAVGSSESGEDGGGEDAVEAPQSLTATASDGAVALQWDAVDGAEGYHVYRSDASFTALDGAERASGSDPLDAPSFEDADVTNGTTYYYRVTAADDGAESDASYEVAATPLPSPPERP